MMFGQGWQNFFERLIDVPSGKLPNRLRKLKSPPDMRDPGKIAEALFQPWRRADDVDGFRWDPEEDQRYALRFGDPSRAGAAATVLGANRLAPIGFLSFPALPAERQMQAVGALRDGGEWCFAWPIWTSPLSRSGIEALLAHPMLRVDDRGELRRLGVVEIYRARRIANGKFMNVTRARPVESKRRVVDRRPTGTDQAGASHYDDSALAGSVLSISGAKGRDMRRHSSDCARVRPYRRFIAACARLKTTRLTPTPLTNGRLCLLETRSTTIPVPQRCQILEKVYYNYEPDLTSFEKASTCSSATPASRPRTRTLTCNATP
jgi:hypothetical protein